MRRISIFAVLAILEGGHASAEDSSSDREITSTMERCGGNLSPAKAFVTNLRTGKVSTFPLDESQDVVPPCGGQLPQLHAFPAIPMNWTIPQLVKIKSDGGQCSGALISANPEIGATAVITAAHCVYKNGTFFKNVRTYPGYTNGTQNPKFGELWGAEVLTFTRYTADRQNSHDIAVIKLEGAVPDPSYSAYGLAPYRSSCDNINRLVFRPHYNPAHQNLQVQVFAGGAVQACYNGMLVTPLPTGGGSSGSAVVDIYSRAIFAVHSAGDGNYSFEAPLTPAKVCMIHNYLGGTIGSPCYLD